MFENKWKIIFAIIVVFLATRIIPYSVNGPAMSCLSVMDEVDNKKTTYEYAQVNGFDLKKTMEFVQNSGFSFRNLSLKDDNPDDMKILTMVFTHRYQFECAPINWLSIDGSILRIDVVRGPKEIHRAGIVASVW